MLLTRLTTAGCTPATRRVLATGALVAAVASSFLTVSAHVPGFPDQPQPASSQPLQTPPSPADAMRAYQVLDGWIRDWNIPDDDSRPEQLSVGGVSIVLRMAGEVIGRSTVFAEGTTLVDAPNGSELLRRAAKAAMAEAERRMRVDNDALRDERVRRSAREVTISLELAGTLVPIEPTTFDDIERDLAPGLDGIAIRVGDQIAGTFPGTLLASNTSLRLAFSRAASQAGGEASLGLDEPKKLRDSLGAKCYRFRVTHLAQRSPDAAPTFIVRGGRFVNLAEINTAELRSMADRAASNLISREWTGEGAYGMHGLYEPWSNQYSPAYAGAVEQLTAAFALRVYASTPGIDPRQSLAAKSYAGRILRALRLVEADETAAADSPVSSALWVVVDSLNPPSASAAPPAPPSVPPSVPPTAPSAAAPTPAPADLNATTAPEACRRVVLNSFNKLDGFASTIPIPARGLMAYALVELAALEPAGGLRTEAIGLADAAVRRAYRDTPEGLLVSQMPWLGFAERRLAAVKQANASDASEIPAAVALRQMRGELWQHQIQPSDAAASESLGGSPDLAGGIVFTGVLSGRQATGSNEPKNVTWQSAQALAFLPSMMIDERLTPAAERPLELARLVSSLRFIRQLQVDDSTTWMIPYPRRALGGTRAALWDMRMSTDATSMSLLLVSETLRAISQMR